MSESDPIPRPSLHLGRSVAWGLCILILIVSARAFGWISFPSEVSRDPDRNAAAKFDRAVPSSGAEAGGSADQLLKTDRSVGMEENPLTDALIREKIVGVWSRIYSGRWDLEIRPDGTGTMTVVPDRLWAVVVGSRITIQMTWDVRDGMAIFDSVSGEPATSFAIVMKMWKKHQERRIVELTESRFVYLSDDGKSNSAWTRVTKEL